jgi:flagellar secretion chaperone FliS
MYETPYDSSLEVRVLSATRIELVQILYDAAIEAVEAARRYLLEGKIAERSRSISKAVAILIELSQSLDHTSGGELSARLAGLYSYMQRALLDANYQQTDGGLSETEQLLKTLRGAWAQIASPTGMAFTKAPAVTGLPMSMLAGPSTHREPTAASHEWSA